MRKNIIWKSLIPTLIICGSLTSCSSNKTDLNISYDLDDQVSVISTRINSNVESDININNNYALDEESSYIEFDSNKMYFKENEFLKYSSNVYNNTIFIPIKSKNIKVHLKTMPLEQWGNNFTEKYQSNFWNNLTYCDHDYVKTDNLYCSSQAEGIYMYTYAPGYKIWNTYLHNNRENEMQGETEVIDQDFGFPSKEDPRDINKGIWHKGLPLKLKDYKYVDEGLNLSKSSISLTVYHGLETNETELINFLNSILNFDIKDGDPEQARKINLDVLKDSSYINLGWCATSLDKEFAMGWAKSQSTEFKSTPVLEITLDKDVSCSYVSYTNKKYFGTYLAWPHEYQILTQRNLKFTLVSGEWIKKENGDNILYIKCNASLK